MSTLKSRDILGKFLDKTDWRVAENSNAPRSIGSMTKHAAGKVYKDYWLTEIYDKVDPRINESYHKGYIHIHDLAGGLTLYCGGYSLKDILRKGVRGVPNIPTSSPAKHLDSALSHICNLTSVFQNEIAGAVAFSSLDTLMAPFIRRDHLTYDQVYQKVQNFIYAINSNSRAGAEPAFSNISIDLKVPRDLKNEEVMIAGEPQGYTYGELQEEIDLFNTVLLDIYLLGDSAGKPFSYPIPTYSITKDFDWDSPVASKLFELSGKFGTPYFSNYVNSDMSPEDCRSMCCRLRLDLRELAKKNGGLFGSGDSTGSIGVVTLNLPRLAYEARVESEVCEYTKETIFFTNLRTYLDLARESLQIKRKFLEEVILPDKLLPAFSEYVGTLKNHFSTIGVIGMNEMCINLLGVPITDPAGKALALRVSDYIRETLSQYQEEDGDILWNYEATPGESTSFRLALIDRKQYPDIYTRGTPDAPYYTNSCHAPVSTKWSVKDMFDHQDDLQIKFTGGTVVHIYCGGPLLGDQAKQLIKTIVNNYQLPYISISPVVTLCEEHGQLDKSYTECPICHKKVTTMQRITGYVRDTRFWNPGKKSEYSDRNQFQDFMI